MMIECNVKFIFMTFALCTLLFMYWNNIQQISRLHHSCVDGHDVTLNTLSDFKTAFEQSDLLVSFIDKSDLEKVEKEKRRAVHQIFLLKTQLQNAQAELKAVKQRLSLHKKQSSLQHQLENQNVFSPAPWTPMVKNQPNLKSSDVEVAKVALPETEKCEEVRRKCTYEKQYIFETKLKMKHLRERLIDCERKYKRMRAKSS